MFIVMCDPPDIWEMGHRAQYFGRLLDKHACVNWLANMMFSMCFRQIWCFYQNIQSYCSCLSLSEVLL